MLAPVLAVGVVLLSAHAPVSATPSGSAAELARGFAAYRVGEYATATKALRAALAKGVRNEDWAQYLLAGSEFYGGAYRDARERFERLARGHGGRPSEVAPSEWLIASGWRGIVRARRRLTASSSRR